jgi:hypothetical protein
MNFSKLKIESAFNRKIYMWEFPIKIVINLFKSKKYGTRNSNRSKANIG